MRLIALSMAACAAAVRITRDAKGVSIWYDAAGDEAAEARNVSLSRRLISGTTCASMGGYTSRCVSTNPSGCGCAALTASEKQEILDLHNARRALAAAGAEDCAVDSDSGRGATKCPAARDMNYLFWDPALEALSTFWAHQCISDHHGTWDDPSAAGRWYGSSDWYGGQQSVLDGTPPERMYDAQCAAGGCKARGFDANGWSNWIGENLAFAGGRSQYSMAHVLHGIASWFDESADYVWSEGRTRRGGDQVGHWTAGVWAASRYVGCGYAVCPSGSAGPWGDSYGQWINVVCKYYPGGNFNSRAPYTVASDNEGPCSACGADRQGCVSAASSVDGVEPVNALCGGAQCSACAVDANQEPCFYSQATCPSAWLSNDGTVGPAMAPTSRPVANSGEPGEAPTVPVQPADPATCSVRASGFVTREYGWNPATQRHEPWSLNGEYTFVGEHDGKPMYQGGLNGEMIIAYSDACRQYIVTDTENLQVLPWPPAYCRCPRVIPPLPLEECATHGGWTCMSSLEDGSIDVSCSADGSIDTPSTVESSEEEVVVEEPPEPLPVDVPADVACGAHESFPFARGEQSRFLQFRLVEPSHVTLSNCHTSFDTILRLWSHDRRDELSQSLGGCDGDDCECAGRSDWHNEQFSISALPAGTYYLQIGPYGSDGTYGGYYAGDYKLDITCETPTQSEGVLALHVSRDLLAVALIACVLMLAMLLVWRRTPRNVYAKLQMRGADSEEATHSEAEDMLHVAD